MYKLCLRCGRPLKSEYSRSVGFGKICEKKSRERAHMKPLVSVKADSTKNLEKSEVREK